MLQVILYVFSFRRLFLLTEKSFMKGCHLKLHLFSYGNIRDVCYLVNLIKCI